MDVSGAGEASSGATGALISGGGGLEGVGKNSTGYRSLKSETRGRCLLPGNNRLGMFAAVN
jgi:hypothetical protein